MRKCRKDLSEREALMAKLKSELYNKNREIKEKDKAIQHKIHPQNDSS